MVWPFTSTQTAIKAGFNQINKRLDIIVATQDDIKNAVDTVNGLLTDLDTENQEILDDLTKIANKIANGTPVDTSELNAVVGRVQGVKDSLRTAVTNLDTLASS